MAAPIPDQKCGECHDKTLFCCWLMQQTIKVTPSTTDEAPLQLTKKVILGNPIKSSDINYDQEKEENWEESRF